MKHNLLLMAVCAAIALILGCGGGSAPHVGQIGSATFRIIWPASTRLIPQASASVKIVVKDGEKVVATRVVPRPTSSTFAVIKIENLPVKKLSHEVSAYPNADGTGVAQAQGTAVVEVKEDQDVAVTITLDSTIDHIDLTPNTNQLLDVGASLKLTAVPRNMAGDAVQIVPNSLNWTSSNAGVASVDNAGLVRAVKAGATAITVTESESKKIASVSVTVQSGGCQVPSNVTNPDAALVGMPAIFFRGDTYTVQLQIARPINMGNDTRFVRVTLPGDQKDWLVDGSPWDRAGIDPYILVDTRPLGTHIFSFKVPQASFCWQEVSVLSQANGFDVARSYAPVASH